MNFDFGEHPISQLDEQSLICTQDAIALFAKNVKCLVENCDLVNCVVAEFVDILNLGNRKYGFTISN